jgi:hypothetical protein
MEDQYLTSLTRMVCGIYEYIFFFPAAPIALSFIIMCHSVDLFTLNVE